MKTAICYYSRHHGNTLKVLEAMAEVAEIDLIDVTSRMAARPGDFTQAGTQRLLPGAGVRGLVLEDGEGGLKVLLGRLLGITQAEAARELDQLLPAHLACRRGMRSYYSF